METVGAIEYLATWVHRPEARKNITFGFIAIIKIIVFLLDINNKGESIHYIEKKFYYYSALSLRKSKKKRRKNILVDLIIK